MLTATYSLLAIRAEQNAVSSTLTRLRQYLRSQQRGHSKCLPEPTLNQFAQFDAYCHARKLEVYVIPLMARTSGEVDELLNELEQISDLATRLLDALRHQVALQADRDFSDFFVGMEQYCEALRRRFSAEDDLLLPMMNCVLTREDWFSLGTQFLAEDGDRYTHRRVAPPLVPSASALAG